MKTQKSLTRRLKLSWQKALLRLVPLGSCSINNRIKVFHNGDEAFLAIYEAIQSAQFSLYIETYIFADDKLGHWILGTVIEAQKRGVKTTILYDHVGSAGLSAAFFQPLIACGARVLAFSPIWPWRRSGPLLQRDHRKIIVVDEKLAFCGGFNITADYAGPRYGTDRFRDTAVAVEGPAVKDLLAITLESIAESSLAEYSDVSINYFDGVKAIRKFVTSFGRKKYSHNSPSPSGIFVQVLRSNQRRNLLHIQRSMEEIVNRAVTYCLFTTPYFLPHEGLRKALVNAKRRGVDVRILTAGISDVPLMRLASHHIYDQFLHVGIRIYEMSKKNLHAKIATIDGVYASVGSYNLDPWSARRNLEVNVAMMDRKIADDLQEQFLIDLKNADEIDDYSFSSRTRFRRFICWVAYLLMLL